MIFFIPEMSFPNVFIGNPLLVIPGFPVELACCKQAGNDKQTLFCRRSNPNKLTIYPTEKFN